MAERKSIIIIPAYEPDQRLISLLKELRAGSDAELIVVNDGSSQEAESIFKEAESYGKVLGHHKNYGKGRAVKTALEYIEKQEWKGEVVIADADGQHAVPDIFLLLKAASMKSGVLVTGCRSFHGNIPFRSRMGNQITRITFRLMSGKWLKDTQTGLRAFDTGLIPRLLAVPGERYEYETNALLMCVKKKISIVEVSVKTIYLEGNKSSHFRVLRDSARIYMNMFKFASSSFLSFCVDYLCYGLILYTAVRLRLSHAIVISNLSARVISASFNYYLNRKYVFESRGSCWRSGVKYGALAAFILLVNTAFLVWLTKDKGINGWAAKFGVEISMFVMSFLVQKLLIFKKSD